MKEAGNKNFKIDAEEDFSLQVYNLSHGGNAGLSTSRVQ